MNTDETKHLVEQLRQQAEELEKILDVAPVAIFVAHDPECHEVTGNPTANAMVEAADGANLSATPDPEAAVPWRFFKDGIEVPPKELPVQVAARSGVEVRNCELEALLPSGERKVLWGQATPLRDAAGQVRGAVGAFQDITHRKQLTEAALHETEERFRTLADTTPDIIWLKNADHRAIFINRAGTEFFGLPAERLTRDRLTQLIHPDDRELADVYKTAVDRQTNGQVEFRARRADGEYRCMLATTGPRYVGGAYVGQAGTLVDVTDLKHRQEEDLARQKLESLGALAGGIAHDFNNLLGAIVAQMELALADLSEGRSTEAEVRTTIGVAMRGAEIVRELMVYAGQDETTLELVNVSYLIEDTLELLKVLVSKHAALQFDLADVPAVRANPGTLRQILINLVTNASEAIGERDGVIKVSTSRVNIQRHSQAVSAALSAGDYCQLEVSDTGCGITPENKSKIFDPFFSTKARGRGLGLAVVQGIVKRLGGAITVSNAAVRGSDFRILLPAAGGPAADSRGRREDTGEARRAAGGTILLVEDEEPMRRAISQMLGNEGFAVLEAAGGSEAKEILRVHAAELKAIILDASLPGIPSPEILREARRLRPDLRIIVTSGYSGQRIASVFSDLEGARFLPKPYRLAEILKLLS